MLIKTLLHTGVRVAELVRILLDDVDLDACRIRITQGKGHKDRVVPFPATFKETLALHIDSQRRTSARYLFESSWKNPSHREPPTRRRPNRSGRARVGGR